MPQKKTERTKARKYSDQFIFMLALLIPAVWLSGFRVVVTCGISLVCCTLIDIICCHTMKRRHEINDFSTYTCALAIGLMMPAQISPMYVIIADVIAIIIGKQIFGGKDNYIFSPSALAISFMIICYPSAMLFYPRTDEIIPVFGEYEGLLGRSLEYTLKMGNIPTTSGIDVLLGKLSGAVGTIHILVIIVCALCLVFRRSISALVTFAGLGSMAAIALLFPRTAGAGFDAVMYELVAGYALFGFVFVANDPQLIPKSLLGRTLYGVTLGVLTMLLRFFGQTEGSFLFALLITNAVSLSFDPIWSHIREWKDTYLGSFEQVKADAQQGYKPKLSDTQEIVIPEALHYETPAMDNKVTKVKRRTEAENDKDVEKMFDGKEREKITDVKIDSIEVYSENKSMKREIELIDIDPDVKEYNRGGKENTAEIHSENESISREIKLADIEPKEHLEESLTEKNEERRTYNYDDEDE